MDSLGGHIDPVFCPKCRKGFYYCFPGIKPQPAERGMLCEDCTKDKLNKLVRVPIWYFELREDNHFLFALIRTRYAINAKKKLMELVDGGEWMCGKLEKGMAFDMLKKFEIGTLYEARIEKDKSPIILPHDGLIGHA